MEMLLLKHKNQQWRNNFRKNRVTQEPMSKTIHQKTSSINPSKFIEVSVQSETLQKIVEARTQIGSLFDLIKERNQTENVLEVVEENTQTKPWFVLAETKKWR